MELLILKESIFYKFLDSHEIFNLVLQIENLTGTPFPPPSQVYLIQISFHP